MEDKIFYNQASSSKLGWLPQDFGCDHFDDELLKAIKILLVDKLTNRKLYLKNKEWDSLEKEYPIINNIIFYL